MTHTDVGYTDHPVVCREQQMRYLDIAIDAVLATRDKPPAQQFCWTAETTLAVDDWWRSAAPARRQELLQAVRSGQLEIAALPMNQTPTLDAAQWQTMLHWIPEDLWQKVQPRVAVQDDVNGFPRAGAVALLDRGVHSLLMGINPTLGAAPLPTPTAFWWKMPDGRRLFVWLGDHYTRGFYYFYADTWRRGPVPESTDTRYRPARPGELFRADDDAVRAAHAHLLGELQKLEAAGYKYPRVVAPVTNEWRMDNDPPFPAMAEFVATWQRLGLQPQLRMTTVGDCAAENAGRDWRSGPRTDGGMARLVGERCGLRPARTGGQSPCQTIDGGGPVSGVGTAARAGDARHQHDSAATCACSTSTRGVPATAWVSRTAWRPGPSTMRSRGTRTARWPWRNCCWLSVRARPSTRAKQACTWSIRPSMPWSGWVVMPASCLRGDFHSLHHPETQEAIPLVFEPGYRPHSVGRCRGVLADQYLGDVSRSQPESAGPVLDRFAGRRVDSALSVERGGRRSAEALCRHRPCKLDDSGWPVAATWPGMEQPLFTAGTGDFQSVSVNGFAGRWSFLDIFPVADPAQREKLRAEKLRVEDAAAHGPASVRQNPHTTVYTPDAAAFASAMADPRAGTVARHAARPADRPPRSPVGRIAGDLLPRLHVALPGCLAFRQQRRPAVRALPGPVARDMPRLLQHRRLAELRDAGRPVAVGHSRRPAGDVPGPPGPGTGPRGAGADQPRAGDAV